MNPPAPPAPSAPPAAIEPPAGDPIPSALARSAARFLAPDEPLLLITRPSPWFILLYRPWRWLLPPAAMVLADSAVSALFASTGRPAPAALGWLPTAAAVWLLAGLLYLILAWLSRLYAVTGRRIVVVAGIIARDAGDVPLANITHSTVTQSIPERLLGLGTIGIATAGADGAAIRWLMVARPDRVLEIIRAAADRARPKPTPPPAPPAPTAPSPSIPASATPAPPAISVIGLAGGIGAGKSEAARILAGLGCTVIDSDLEARAALDRPEVRDELVRWWGRGILDASGSVDRKAVARIVFSDAKERRRLEGLVHPIVRATRGRAIARAAAAGSRAAVVDAPLLFEAGVDAECDAVIFIDAPRPLRLERVRARGWDESELDRREASQLPLDEKRRRSTVVVDNSASPADLAARLGDVLDQILRAGPRRAE